MHFVLAKMEECTTASDVVKLLTILVATGWIAQVWSKVKPNVIKKCFRNADILNPSLQVISREIPLY